MNDHMWAHPQTQRNVAHLRELGYQIVDPDEGMLAAGEGSGPGRMPEPEIIFAHVGRLLERGVGCAGKRVLVTAGPTREAIDPVRFISNHSSGKMGVALAAAAWRRGASVDLVAGPLSVAAPPGVTVHAVESTEDMAAAVGRLLPRVGRARDGRRAGGLSSRRRRRRSKIKKTQVARTRSRSTRRPTFCSSTKGARRPGAVVVGFALETNDVVANGRQEARGEGSRHDRRERRDRGGRGLRRRHESRDAAARVTAMTSALPLMPKTDVADAILDRVERLIGGR